MSNLEQLPFLICTGGFGGLHAFAIFWAVKIKIVLIVVAVGFAIFYYTKFLAIKKKYELNKYGKYSGYPSGIREGGLYDSWATSQYSLSPIFIKILILNFSPYPNVGYPTGYSSLLDIASFDGSDPYSAYHHDHEYGHNPHYDHDHDHDHEIFHDHDDEHDHHHDHEQILADAPTENGPPSMSPTRRRRVGRQKRAADVNQQQIEYLFFAWNSMTNFHSFWDFDFHSGIGSSIWANWHLISSVFVRMAVEDDLFAN